VHHRNGLDGRGCMLNATARLAAPAERNQP
jgi:hypothetical protein